MGTGGATCSNALLQLCLVIYWFILGLDKGRAAQAILGSVLRANRLAGVLPTFHMLKEIYGFVIFWKETEAQSSSTR